MKSFVVSREKLINAAESLTKKTHENTQEGTVALFWYDQDGRPLFGTRYYKKGTEPDLVKRYMV